MNINITKPLKHSHSSSSRSVKVKSIENSSSDPLLSSSAPVSISWATTSSTSLAEDGSFLPISVDGSYNLSDSLNNEGNLLINYSLSSQDGLTAEEDSFYIEDNKTIRFKSNGDKTKQEYHDVYSSAEFHNNGAISSGNVYDLSCSRDKMGFVAIGVNGSGKQAYELYGMVSEVRSSSETSKEDIHHYDLMRSLSLSSNGAYCDPADNDKLSVAVAGNNPYVFVLGSYNFYGSGSGLVKVLYPHPEYGLNSNLQEHDFSLSGTTDWGENLHVSPNGKKVVASFSHNGDGPGALGEIELGQNFVLVEKNLSGNEGEGSVAFRGGFDLGDEFGARKFGKLGVKVNNQGKIIAKDSFGSISIYRPGDTSFDWATCITMSAAQQRGKYLFDCYVDQTNLDRYKNDFGTSEDFDYLAYKSAVRTISFVGWSGTSYQQLNRDLQIDDLEDDRWNISINDDATEVFVLAVNNNATYVSLFYKYHNGEWYKVSEVHDSGRDSAVSNNATEIYRGFAYLGYDNLNSKNVFCQTHFCKKYEEDDNYVPLMENKSSYSLKITASDATNSGLFDPVSKNLNINIVNRSLFSSDDKLAYFFTNYQLMNPTAGNDQVYYTDDFLVPGNPTSVSISDESLGGEDSDKFIITDPEYNTLQLSGGSSSVEFVPTNSLVPNADQKMLVTFENTGLGYDDQYNQSSTFDMGSVASRISIHLLDPSDTMPYRVLGEEMNMDTYKLYNNTTSAEVWYWPVYKSPHGLTNWEQKVYRVKNSAQNYVRTYYIDPNNYNVSANDPDPDDYNFPNVSYMQRESEFYWFGPNGPSQLPLLFGDPLVFHFADWNYFFMDSGEDFYTWANQNNKLGRVNSDSEIFLGLFDRTSDDFGYLAAWQYQIWALASSDYWSYYTLNVYDYNGFPKIDLYDEANSDNTLELGVSSQASSGFKSGDSYYLDLIKKAEYPSSYSDWSGSVGKFRQSIFGKKRLEIYV